MASTSQDSSFGDDNTQDQDPLAIEPKVGSDDFQCHNTLKNKPNQ